MMRAYSRGGAPLGGSRAWARVEHARRTKTAVCDSAIQTLWPVFTRQLLSVIRHL